MTQRPSGNYDIVPATTTGTELATILNEDNAAENSTHSGTTRPAYVAAGGTWVKTNGSDLELYLYDGTNDQLVGLWDASEDEWLIKAGTVEVNAVAPTSPQTGRPWYDGTDLWVWDGAAWDQIQTDTGIVTVATGSSETGTTYTLLAADAGKNIYLSNTGTVNIYVPDNATLDLPEGYQVTLINRDSGTINVSRSGSTATINGATAINDCIAEHGAAYLVQVADDDWELIY